MIIRLCVVLAFVIQAQAATPVDLTLPDSELTPLVRVRVKNKILKVPLESYLMGVLPSEMSLSWPLEALKAQAVAARSFVLSQMQRRQSSNFDVESTHLDQVFRVEHLNYAGPYRKKLLQVLQETKGEVLLEPQKNVSASQIQKTYFHSDCGGSTETSFYVWRTQEPLLQVQDSSCPVSQHSKWEIKFSLKTLEEKLNLPGIKSLQVTTKTPSGRNGTILVLLNNGDKELFLADTFRKRLGFNKVKSTYFDLALQNGDYVFSGRGHGHGVGMCQWGARVLAQQGLEYKKILTHYFPLSRLENIKNIERPLYAGKL